MDVIADEIRTNPKYGPDDDQIAFRQLQRIRVAVAKLNRGMEWLNLFGVWRDRYRARQEARRAEVPMLWRERDELLAERASLPSDERIAHIDARLAEVARTLAVAIFA